MRKVRAKLQLQPHVADYGDTSHFHLMAMYEQGDEAENKAFSDATPAASLNISIQKDKPAHAFFAERIGKEFYLDFTPVEAEEPQADGEDEASVGAVGA